MPDPQADLALPQGFNLQEYRIESMLGVGGFGLTYLATDANLKLRVAIKEYLPSDLALREGDHTVRPKSDGHSASFKWGLDRFLDESRALASFRHPNIVRVMRFFEANRTAYMVMEFVAGQPLSEWVRTRRPIGESAARTLLRASLDGLEVVHGAGYLHRDIKPANIFMREDDSPVLLDFGSARMVNSGSSELTAIVTPGYAPLEQYHEQGKQGPWSDLYALGGVMYWLVTGNKPVDATARVRSDPLPAAAQAGDRSRYTSEFLSIVDWMLMPNEEQRPQSVAQLRAALQGEPATTAEVTRVLERQATARVSAPPPPVSAPDPQALKTVEADLSQHIGPIAGVVMSRAAKRGGSLGEIVEAVAREIDDDAARTAFVRKHASAERSRPTGAPSMPTGRSGSVPTALAMQRFDAAVIDRCERALAQHLGPLARVVVKRAAMKARDETELWLLAGDDIEDKDARKAFVRMAQARR